MRATHIPRRPKKKPLRGKKVGFAEEKLRLWGGVGGCLGVDIEGRAQNIESTEKVGKGAILPFFLQITYGHSQLSIIGGECFFVVGGVRAFGGEALAQVVDFVVVLLKKKGGLFV